MKLQILMLSIVDPAEARGGSWTVTRGLIKALDVAWPGSEIECISLSAHSRISHRYRQLRSIIGSTLGGDLPAKIAFARSTGFRRRLQSTLAASTPDLIIINGSDLLWVMPECPQGVPVVVMALNIEHELYARQIARAAKPGSLVARILRRDYQKLRSYEWSGMRKAGRVIFLSEEDLRLAAEACPDLDTILIPPLFEYEPLPRVAEVNGSPAVGMFADFTWWPNRVSLEWFLREIWPSVSPELELHLMGHGSERAAQGVRGITSHGSVRDPRDAFARCHMMIAPIIEGAGVRVKVAEALYNRVPIAATSFAIRGLSAAAVSSVRVCDSPAEWISFLTNDAVTQFVHRSVPVDAAATFSLARAADSLNEFLQGGEPIQQSTIARRGSITTAANAMVTPVSPPSLRSPPLPVHRSTHLRLQSTSAGSEPRSAPDTRRRSPASTPGTPPAR